jgi:predicted DNA-binding transcriptional regulator YafY
LTELVDVSHYLALRVAMGQTTPLRATSGVFATLEDLSDKLEKVLGPRERSQLKAIDACFHSYEKFDYRSSPPDVFWPLIEAIAERRLCQVTYRAPRPGGHPTRFVLLPLRLFAHDGAVYLYAHVPRHDQVITLNLHRLLRLTVQEQTGKPPADFRPEQWESSAFRVFSSLKEAVAYRLRFSAEVAPYIRERVWHPSQVLRELPAGGLELTFSCSPSYEGTAWVSSWGKNVEVLEPEGLRRDLHVLGGWLLGTYGPDRSKAG